MRNVAQGLAVVAANHEFISDLYICFTLLLHLLCSYGKSLFIEYFPPSYRKFIKETFGPGRCGDYETFLINATNA